jgi:deoxyribonuclease V
MSVSQEAGVERIVEKARSLHPWTMKPREAVEVQRLLASQIVLSDDPSLKKARVLAAFDISARRFGKTLYAAAVAWDMKEGKLLQVSRAAVAASFPYIPGLLSFREMPAMIEAFSGLHEVPDLILCDAHGLMHPRFFGLACHAGLATGIPTIGCAKSRLVGEHGEPGQEKGQRCIVTVGGRKAGYVLRSRSGSKPLYVSPGHRISCVTAVGIVLSLLDKTRIPVPLRAAHNEAIAYMRGMESD